MKVYQIQAEGEYRIVEAESYGEAVKLWLAEMIREFAWEDADDTDPESVTLLRREG